VILVACPACDRQYDVTHVPVGHRVRCVCDEIIRVGTQGSLQVRALHCSGCGGPLEGTEETCRWCGAKLSDADRGATTLCPKCFARLPDDARHCQACGVAIAPQALTPLPADKVCPRCRGELQIRSLGVADVIECSACGSLWLGVQVFEAVCRDAERRLDTFLLAKGEPPAAVPNSNQRYIPCLTCGQLMNRRSFRRGQRASGVVVDHCRDHGVWLDRDELERIASFLRTQGPGDAAAPAGTLPYLEVPYDAERARLRRRAEERALGGPVRWGGLPGDARGAETVLRIILKVADIFL
jgi:Zn-finger nucleic acid-binding protein